jgi:hypothetical protein
VLAQIRPSLGLLDPLRPESPISHPIYINMATAPAPGLDTVVVASAAVGVAPIALAVAIATIQAVAVVSRERAVGTVAAVGAPVGPRHRRCRLLGRCSRRWCPP